LLEDVNDVDEEDVDDDKEEEDEITGVGEFDEAVVVVVETT
jgi:hypothetical protein